MKTIRHKHGLLRSVGYTNWRTMPRLCRALADQREHRSCFFAHRRLPDRDET